MLCRALLELADRAGHWKQYPYSEVDGEVVNDAAATVACRLIEHGPRGDRESDPADDATTQAWLKTCLSNQLRDVLRKRAGLEGLESSENVPTAQTPVDEGDDVRRLDRAHALLVSHLLPLACTLVRKDAAENVTKCINEMSLIRKGHATLRQLILVEFDVQGTEATPELLRSAELRRHKAYQRARERAHEAIPVAERRGIVTAEVAADLRKALDELRLRG